MNLFLVANGRTVGRIEPDGEAYRMDVYEPLHGNDDGIPLLDDGSPVSIVTENGEKYAASLPELMQKLECGMVAEEAVVPLDRIEDGPIRHRHLTKKQVKRIGRLFRHRVHRLIMQGQSLEQWEVGFMRDADPDREIGIWEAICQTFDKYIAAHPEVDQPMIAACSLLASTGVEPKSELATEIKKLFREVHPESSLIQISAQ